MTDRERLAEVEGRAGDLLPEVERELSEAILRRQRARARCRSAEDEVERLSALKDSLRRVCNGSAPADERKGLRGWRIGDAAAEVLRDAGKPLHYAEVWRRLQESGAVVVSPEPEAVVLTAITRHPEIRRAGRGIYGLADSGLSCGEGG